MSNFRDYNRNQSFLLPPDLRDWVADDDLAHFIVAAVEHVDISAFHVSRTGFGKAQYHPRMMLALLIYCYGSGIFSSRRIEQASYRNVSVRFIAANTHPDHDTIATFRRRNGPAFAAAFNQVLLLAQQTGLLKLGTVSLDGTKLDANASKIKSLRYDRIKALREQLALDIAELMARAEAADTMPEDDGLSLPQEIARRQALKAKLDAAAKRLEEAAQNDGEDDPGPPPAPETQTNLTDPDSALMRKSARHEYRQAYNGQAVVDADGSQLVLATNVLGTSDDRAELDELLDQLCQTLGTPETLLADAGYAGETIVEGLAARGIEPWIAVSRPERRIYDFRPPRDTAVGLGQSRNNAVGLGQSQKSDRPRRQIKAQWRLDMAEKLKSPDGRQKYKKRKSTVEPVFGIIKSVLGFTRFHLRGLSKVKSEWKLVTLAYNCKRLAKLQAA